MNFLEDEVEELVEEITGEEFNTLCGMDGCNEAILEAVRERVKANVYHLKEEERKQNEEIIQIERPKLMDIFYSEKELYEKKIKEESTTKTTIVPYIETTLASKMVEESSTQVYNPEHLVTPIPDETTVTENSQPQQTILLSSDQFLETTKLNYSIQLSMYKQDVDILSRIKGLELRGKDYGISTNGSCPRCGYKWNVFVILDSCLRFGQLVKTVMLLEHYCNDAYVAYAGTSHCLFPAGDMPEILQVLLTQGKAILWSSKQNMKCKEPPTFLCSGNCPFTDIKKCGFNLDWKLTDLEKIFLSPTRKTDGNNGHNKEDDVEDEDYYEDDDDGEDYGDDGECYGESDGDFYGEDEMDEEEYDEGHVDIDYYRRMVSWYVLDEFVEDQDKVPADWKEMIRTMLALEQARDDFVDGKMKTLNDSKEDVIDISSDEKEESPAEDIPKNAGDITKNNDVDIPKKSPNDDFEIYDLDDSGNVIPPKVIHILDDAESKTTTNQQQPKEQQKKITADSFPVSKDGSCPYCHSTNVIYIILKDDEEEPKLPELLARLKKDGKAECRIKGQHEWPSFQCRGCTYGFNLDWTSSNLENIFYPIPKKTVASQPSPYVKSSTLTHVTTASTYTAKSMAMTASYQTNFIPNTFPMPPLPFIPPPFPPIGGMFPMHPMMPPPGLAPELASTLMSAIQTVKKQQQMSNIQNIPRASTLHPPNLQWNQSVAPNLWMAPPPPPLPQVVQVSNNPPVFVPPPANFAVPTQIPLSLPSNLLAVNPFLIAPNLTKPPVILPTNNLSATSNQILMAATAKFMNPSPVLQANSKVAQGTSSNNFGSNQSRSASTMTPLKKVEKPASSDNTLPVEMDVDTANAVIDLTKDDENNTSAESTSIEKVISTDVDLTKGDDDSSVCSIKTDQNEDVFINKGNVQSAGNKIAESNRGQGDGDDYPRIAEPVSAGHFQNTMDDEKSKEVAPNENSKPLPGAEPIIKQEIAVEKDTPMLPEKNIRLNVPFVDDSNGNFGISRATLQESASLTNNTHKPPLNQIPHQTSRELTNVPGNIKEEDVTNVEKSNHHHAEVVELYNTSSYSINAFSEAPKAIEIQQEDDVKLQLNFTGTSSVVSSSEKQNTDTIVDNASLKLSPKKPLAKMNLPFVSEAVDKEEVKPTLPLANEKNDEILETGDAKKSPVTHHPVSMNLPFAEESKDKADSYTIAKTFSGIPETESSFYRMTKTSEVHKRPLEESEPRPYQSKYARSEVSATQPDNVKNTHDRKSKVSLPFADDIASSEVRKQPVEETESPPHQTEYTRPEALSTQHDDVKSTHNTRSKATLPFADDIKLDTIHKFLSDDDDMMNEDVAMVIDSNSVSKMMLRNEESASGANSPFTDSLFNIVSEEPNKLDDRSEQKSSEDCESAADLPENVLEPVVDEQDTSGTKQVRRTRRGRARGRSKRVDVVNFF